MAAGRSWSHALERLAGNVPASWRCSMRAALRQSCPEPVEFAASYSYTTGRSGRVGRRTLALCARHARAFAECHHVKLPTEGGLDGS